MEDSLQTVTVSVEGVGVTEDFLADKFCVIRDIRLCLEKKMEAIGIHSSLSLCQDGIDLDDDVPVGHLNSLSLVAVKKLQMPPVKENETQRLKASNLDNRFNVDVALRSRTTPSNAQSDVRHFAAGDPARRALTRSLSEVHCRCTVGSIGGGDGGGTEEYSCVGGGWSWTHAGHHPYTDEYTPASLWNEEKDETSRDSDFSIEYAATSCPYVEIPSWTDYDDALLLAARVKYGPAWQLMARALWKGNRTAEDICRRWNSNEYRNRGRSLRNLALSKSIQEIVERHDFFRSPRTSF